MKQHILYDRDNPGPQEFDSWHDLLVYVWDKKVTGYGLCEQMVVDFRKGKRKDVNGKWIHDNVFD